MSAPQPDTSGVTVWRRATSFERGIYTNPYRWLGRRPDHGQPGRWSSATSTWSGSRSTSG